MTREIRPAPRTSGVKPSRGITVAVVGSRSWPSEAFVHQTLDTMLIGVHDLGDGTADEAITAIVSGGARGVDQMGARWAKANDLYLIEHLPEWDRLGKRAGFVRNQYIVEDADAVVAFMVHGSRGTQLSVDLARQSGTALVVYTEDHLKNWSPS